MFGRNQENKEPTKDSLVDLFSKSGDKLNYNRKNILIDKSLRKPSSGQESLNFLRYNSSGTTFHETPSPSQNFNRPVIIKEETNLKKIQIPFTQREKEGSLEIDTMIKPKIDKFNQAQQILATQKDKITRNAFNIGTLNNLSLSPNFSKNRLGSPFEIECITERNAMSVKKESAKCIFEFKGTTEVEKINKESEGMSTSRSKLNIINLNKENLQNFNNFDCEDEDQYLMKGKTKEHISNLKCRNQSNSLHVTQHNTYSYTKGKNMNDERDLEMRIFLTKTLDVEMWLKCVIDRKIIDKKTTKFTMVLNDGGKFLMSATKKSKKSYLCFMSNTAFSKKDKDYLGKLKSNFFGTEFNAYDEGQKPKKERNKELHRHNLLSITYETNLFGLKGPRKMKVYMPYVKNDDYSCDTFRCTGTDDTLRKRYYSRTENNILALINKQPEWSEKHNYYVLDYKDRNIKQSVKNFQLIKLSNSPEASNSNNDDVLLQFARTGENSFIIDFKFPFSPIQAFFIALSSIDNKLACE